MPQKQDDSPDPCEFSFLCSKTWAELRPTFTPGVRFCDGCRRDVFLIVNRAQLEEARALGRCVAWAQPPTLRSRSAPSMLLGDPVL